MLKISYEDMSIKQSGLAMCSLRNGMDNLENKRTKRVLSIHPSIKYTFCWRSIEPTSSTHTKHVSTSNIATESRALSTRSAHRECTTKASLRSLCYSSISAPLSFHSHQLQLPFP
ncbi:hypothetical protein EX30DRAFT_263555 [Ascodesmis nigricans]|uniref:Uncharacterized protein n=1 Tax=Ascodesmis nigricans TaxID=341454 RepID=A0A4S2MXK4_9PEZI|nr:hypothetical protein EX30DRAFT_263555 [Ascodesmis nigricans]